MAYDIIIHSWVWEGLHDTVKIFNSYNWFLEKERDGQLIRLPKVQSKVLYIIWYWQLCVTTSNSKDDDSCHHDIQRAKQNTCRRRVFLFDRRMAWWHASFASTNHRTKWHWMTLRSSSLRLIVELRKVVQCHFVIMFGSKKKKKGSVDNLRTCAFELW